MGLIPEDVIAQIIDRTDIVTMVGGYIPLKKTGRNFKGACPFHNEKTPSFIVNPDKQIFHCFGCGAGGNVIRFVMMQEHLDFPQALRMLADKAGISLPENRVDPVQDTLARQVVALNEVAVEYFRTNLMSGAGDEIRLAREYLRARSINAETAKRFNIGYAYDRWDGLLLLLRQKGFSADVIERSGLVVMRDQGKGCYDRFRGRIVFSIFDHRGRPVAFGARSLKKDDQAKYINSPETPVYTKGRHLYGFNLSKEAAGQADKLVIVEGYLDFIRPYAGGVENVAASLGTALTVDQIRLIRRYTRNVVMLYDMDTAGQMASLRSLDVLLDEDMDVRIATLSEGDDPDSFILKYGIDEFRTRLLLAKSLFEFKLESLTAQYPVATIEGRGRICQEMIPTIERVRSEVVKSGYFQELAQRLKVSETALHKERNLVSRTSAPVTVAGGRVSAAASKPSGLPADEAEILRLVLKDARWAQLLRTVADTDDFTHPVVRKIITVLFEDIDLGRKTSAAFLWERIDDQESRRILAAGAVDNGEPSAGEERVLNDCLARLRKTRIRHRREEVRRAIRLAEESKDPQRVLELQKEFNQLVKE